MTDRSDWMNDLSPDLSLINITLPGSHDAGTYGIDVCSKWFDGYKSDPTVDRISKIASYVAPCIVVNYSKVQNIDLVDQFKLGIRYWDIRFAKHNNSYFFIHGLMGSDAIKDIKSLVEYSKYHPKEILLLDFRMFHGMTDDDHKELQRIVLDIVGDRLVDNSFNVKTKLSRFWDENKNIVIIYNNINNQHFWSSRSNVTLWPNTVKADKAINYFQDIIDRSGNRYDDNKLLGLQYTLTPDTDYVVKHLLGSTQNLVKPLNDKIVEFTEKNKGRYNYLMYDIVEYPNMAETIIKSNFNIIS